MIMFYMISTVSYYINSTDVQKHVELFQLIRRVTYLETYIIENPGDGSKSYL